MQNPKLMLVFGALALALAGPQAVDGAPVLDDALQGSTTGMRSGLVRLQGRSFCDDTGPFLGLGASYFQALRHAKYDRKRLNGNLALLASKGFNYVRILSMVSWDGLEIAPVSFSNRNGRTIPAWPDYWQQFRDLLDLAGQHGLRVEVTVFADAQYVMPAQAARRAHLDGILASIAGREHRVLYLEVANEAWQNGFPGSQGVADLRAFTRHLADRTGVPVAITSNDDTSDQGIISLYRGSAADLATVHFSRDIRTAEGGWLPVRDPYRAGNLPGVPPVISNEPIGPGSSVNSESDPIKLCSAAVFAYLANLPAYVYHSRAGVYGYVRCCPPAGGEDRFEDSAGINAYRFIRQILPPDVVSWARNDGLEPGAPLTVFCNDRPDRYWPDASRPADGCLRNIGSVKGSQFVCFPMGILGGGVTLQARRPVRFQVFNPLTGAVVLNQTLNAGDRFTLPQGPGAYICKGGFLDAAPGEPILHDTAVPLDVAPVQPGESYAATVRITDRVLNTVKPLLFGDNIEWTNDGMGFWLPKERGFDEKLVEEVRAAGVTHLRYPGGTLSDYFDWYKAVGDKRHSIPNPFAEGRPEDPRFGPDEFFALCRKLNIPGTITLNAGTGKPEDAAGWVKHCRERGFSVTAFAVGNEIYMAKPSEPIAKTPEQYIDFYLKCREAIAKVAPDTKMGVIGLHDTGAFSLSRHKDWMEKVLRALGDKISFIDLHNGYAPVARVVIGDPKAKPCSDDEFAACFLGASVYVEQNLQATKGDLAKYAPGGGKNIELHVTEYGPLVYPVRPQQAAEDASWNCTLAAALYQACLFNVFSRESKLTSANHLPLHQDVFGALIGVHSPLLSRPKHWRNIVFHVFQMYSKMAGREVLAAEVQSPAYSTPAVGIVPALEKVPCLDVGAYRTRNGDRLTLFLINRDLRRSAIVKLDLGPAPWRMESLTLLSAESYKTRNSDSEPNRVVPVTGPGQDLNSLRVPKHSLLRVELGKP